MTSFPPDSEIHQFWSWFASVAGRLAAEHENSGLLDQLNTRVESLGQIVWEIGPGHAEENAFVLSPDGAPEWLPVTRQIVAMAPEVPGWEFHPARPPKQWDLRFSMGGANGDTLEIDARPWRYVLFKFPDGTFDIVVEQSNLKSSDVVDADERWLACVILLDGLLGEATRMSFIADIEPVGALEPEHAARATPVERMPAHFDSLSGSD